MKRYLPKIFTLALASTVLISCHDQLEEYNPSGFTVESILNTPSGLETALNAAYTYQRELYGKIEGHGLMEVGTDLWTIASAAQEPQLATYENLKTDQSWLRSKMWQPSYAAINLINTALANLNTVPVEAARKPVMEGELKFLRAWYYWHLVETFGPIHFTLEPTEGMVTTANRTPVEEVYAQILADLQVAVANLPVTPPKVANPQIADYGRVTKPTAEAFLARIYLTRGQNQEASSLAKKVISSYGFKLVPNYADLWRMNNLRNSEIIWAINHSPVLTYNGGSNKASTIYGFDYRTIPGMTRDLANGRPDARYMPTRYLLELFNEQNDARFAGSFKQVWYANDAKTLPAGMKLGDTAVYISKNEVPAQKRTDKKYRIYDISDVYQANGTPKNRFQYISLTKHDDPTRPNANEDQSSRDVFLIRLAEMYLIVAEAELKLNNLGVAAEYLNKVRERAALPGRQNEMQVQPGEITLDFILDERAREFAGEQMRWFDLKRTGKLVERVKKYNPDAAPHIQPYHVLRPIPQAQMDAVTNKLDFGQNDGY
jgi:starch-binding outer membrane protein, SusD/RagB family